MLPACYLSSIRAPISCFLFVRLHGIYSAELSGTCHSIQHGLRKPAEVDGGKAQRLFHGHRADQHRVVIVHGVLVHLTQRLLRIYRTLVGTLGKQLTSVDHLQEKPDTMISRYLELHWRPMVFRSP